MKSIVFSLFMLFPGTCCVAAGLKWPTSFQVKDGDTFTQKAWSTMPGFDVVLAFNPKTHHASLGLVQIKPEPTLVSTASVDVLFKDEATSDFDPAPILDLAPYRVTEKESAIGLRWKQHEEFPAGENETEKLALFRREQDQLKLILLIEMSSSDEQRSANAQTVEKCTLAVVPKKTKDFYELRKNCKRIKTSLSEDGPNKSTTENTITIFGWDGKIYVKIK